MNHDHLPVRTVLNSRNTRSLVKLYWDARRKMEVQQVLEQYTLLIIGSSNSSSSSSTSSSSSGGGGSGRSN